MGERRRAEIHYLPLTDLAGWPGNPRIHDVEGIAASIKAHGMGDPIKLDSRTGRIVAGHGTVKGCELLREHHKAGTLPELPDLIDVDEESGEWLLPVYVGLNFPTDEEAARFIVAHNKAHERGGWDKELLARMVELAAGDDDAALEELLLDADEAEELRALLEVVEEDEAASGLEEDTDGDEPEEPEDLAPTAGAEARERLGVEVGQVWALAPASGTRPHLLAVGDCTNPELRELLRKAGAERGALGLTDPPYNIAEAHGMDLTRNIRPDSYGELKEAEWDKGFEWEPVGDALLELLEEQCAVYVFMSHHTAPDVWAWMRSRLDYDGWCVWCKSNPMPSLSKLRWTFGTELVGYGTRGKLRFNFPEQGHALNWWTFPALTAGRIHPTQKPVELLTHIIRHASNEGDTVVDVCAGSGAALIAAHATRRRFVGFELDPERCALILERARDVGLRPSVVEGWR